MSHLEKQDDYGVVASIQELVAMRPPRAATGFDPGGRVSTHQFGSNHSIYRGRGVEFDESRVYQPGDDIRSIDWRVTARTGQMHTKLYHEERERPVYVLLDTRAMMHFGTRDCFKSVLAAKIAAQLVWVAVDGGDRAGALVLNDESMRFVEAKRSRTRALQLLKIMSESTRATGAQGKTPDSTNTQCALKPSLGSALARIRRSCRPGSLVFIVSDFTDLSDQDSRELERLALHTQVSNVFVFDGLEEALPVGGAYGFSDGQQVSYLNSRTANVRDTYVQTFQQRRECLESLSRKNAMAFVPIQTGDDPASILTPHRSSRLKGRIRSHRRLAA